MRLQVAKSWDFNQMLVASVFCHLLFMTVVIFLPPSTYEEIVITPAFVVELVDNSNSQKKAVQKPARKNKFQKKTKPPKPPAPKASKAPPPPDASAKMLERLNQLDDKAPGGLVEELDQLAKLVPKAPPPKPVVKKAQPIQEKTFDETNAFKNKPMDFKPEPLPQEDPLDQFENLKMEEKLAVDPLEPESPVNQKMDSSLKELEFASLSRTTRELEKKQDERSAVDLLQELTKRDPKPLSIDEPAEIPNYEIATPSTRPPEESQAFDPIIKKLEALNYNQPEDIETDIVSTKSFNQEFQSDIRKVNVPKQVTVEVVASPASEAYVKSLTEGDPGADVLSQYVGLIHEKVYKNWREPLAEKHNKEVVFSFYIYPKGNIDRPELKRSSRVELLDNLALRAILESEPFPPFPKEIDSSNLNISIHFKYIPEKGRT
ncbi:MAG: hypothetical protein NPINA01_25430 [Nitrospinaceae bacterium]|nr:MAG: hypothetical protein NPINA01_25430 [Nitrospinaceae bacterium]